MTKARVDEYIVSAVHNAIREARFLGIIVELGPDFQLITLRLEIVRFVLREYDDTNALLE
jgi:hypothetical protein